LNIGLIVKLSKKGDLQICDNWRGITLLSVPSKVFTKILLKRIDEKIDEKLREEQAGFIHNVSLCKLSNAFLKSM
jgi:hypothetical protein